MRMVLLRARLRTTGGVLDSADAPGPAGARASPTWPTSSARWRTAGSGAVATGALFCTRHEQGRALVGPLGSRIGSFRLGPERVVFVGYLLGSIRPAAFDFGTGRLRGFALRPDGSLTAGPR